MNPATVAGFALAAAEAGVIAWLLVRRGAASRTAAAAASAEGAAAAPSPTAAASAEGAAAAPSPTAAAPAVGPLADPLAASAGILAGESPAAPALVPLDTATYERAVSALFESITRYLNGTSEPMSETLVRIKTAIAEFLASVNRSKSSFEKDECADRMKDGIDRLWRHIAEMTDQTARSYNAFAGEIDRLNGLMASIVKLLESISDIAERVHVLSINASIEAARSGVHGKGFKVIADEIQKLSGETQSFVATIGTTIGRTQELFKSLRSVMEDTQAVVSKQVNEDSSVYEGMHRALERQLNEFVLLYAGIARFIESLEMDMKALFPLSMLHAIVTQEIENAEKFTLDFIETVRDARGDGAALAAACAPERTVERLRRRLTTERELEALASALRTLGLQDKIDLRRTSTDIELF